VDNEKNYLYRAIEKAGVVVIVKRLMKAYNGKVRIDYISDNADYFGLNTRAVLDGYRLLEDYVHPDDREKLKYEVAVARANRMDYTCEFRFVDDGGRMRPLILDAMFTEDEQGDDITEFLVREQTYQKKADETAGEKDRMVGDISISRLFDDLRIGELIREFAASFNLYSAVMDMKDQVIGNPVGPTAYFGEFYEMLRNPNNLEYFENMRACIRSGEGPVYEEIPDGNPDNRLSAAPIMVNGIYMATWLLYAHTRQQNQVLFHVQEQHGKIASILSDILSRLAFQESGGEELAAVEDRLNFLLNERKILLALQELSGDKKELFQRMSEAGSLLNLDYIVYYSQDKKNPERMTLEDYWSRTGKSADAESVFVWDNDHYPAEVQRQIREGGLIVDQRNMTNQMRVEVFGGTVRAIMVFPVMQKGQYTGRLIFIESTRERVWREDEIDFARMLCKLVAKKLRTPKSIKKTADGAAFEIFDLVEYPIFARDSATGEVIFSNRAMNLAIGVDFTKKNSFEIIPPAVDAFEGYRDAESASEHEEEKQVTSRFRRYISRLSGIYNVTEHRMKWKDKKPASLFILQEVKEESFGGY